uniref:t-SNARE coiled-coil homology domain-containing protein n=1 Tax=Percolomonas cosmopolitus TaxID=63605 RepID=A0A7S1KND4_9EUKA
MPFLNRTQEFQQIFNLKRQSHLQYRSQKASLAQSKQKNRRNGSDGGGRNDKLQQRSDFHLAAKEISRDLQYTVEMLEQLTKLIKKQTPFDDQHSPQIRHLTVQLKERLSTHKHTLDELHTSLTQNQQNNSKKSTHQQQKKHSETVINGLNSKLSYSVQQFQHILKNRTKQMKKQEKRQEMYGITSSFTPQHGLTPNAHSTVRSPAVSNMPLNGSQMQQQDTMLSVIQSNEDYIRQRSSEIQEIESEIVQIGGMFNQLAIMVKQQGELTQTIDQNVTDAEHYVDQAQSELLKYLRRVSSNRGLVLKIFLVMIVFMVFIGAFVLA